MIFMLIYLACVVLWFVGLWKVFEKAGRPGWEGIVPIYNFYILIVFIVGRPWWWLLMFLIPIANLIFGVIIMIDLAKSFGQGVGFAIGLLLLPFIFYLLLGFGPYKYGGKPVLTILPQRKAT